METPASYSHPSAVGHGRIWLGAALLWVAAFSGLFFVERLPNNPEITRRELWAAMPDIYLELLAPTRTAEAVRSGWEYLPQRFPAWTVAGLILCGAWGWGCAGLRLLLGRAAAVSRLEHTVLAFGLGLAGLSLATLICGKLGHLQRGTLGAIVLGGLLTGLPCWWITLRDRRRMARDRDDLGSRQGDTPARFDADREPTDNLEPFRTHRRLLWLCGTAAIPFVVALGLGATLPPVDFDVREYHLQGPKEFFLAGRVEFLAHNVYTSFPFLTEMLSLLGMVLCDDWYLGALAGKVVLSAFPLLAAATVVAIGRRLVSAPAGLLGGFILLSTPWIYRIGIIAYAEGGLTFYLIGTVLCLILAASPHHAGNAARLVCLSGLFAGSAMACKYTGLVSVVLPAAVAVAWMSSRLDRSRATAEINANTSGREPRSPRPSPRPSPHRSSAVLLLAFGMGTALTAGPWLLKNWSETGNPVYPLAYNIFGGADWNPELNAKWRAAHSPPPYRLRDIPITLWDLSARSDWLSPLLYAFAPVAMCGAWTTYRSHERRERRPGLQLRELVVYAGWLYASWWLLTHRIDRFWVPMLPVVATLAGAGAVWSRSVVWRSCVSVVIVAATVFNLGFITTPYAGLNTYLADLEALRGRIEKPGIRYLNVRLPATARVLSVGEAALFDARFDSLYNTVFDVSLLESLCRPDPPSIPANAESPVKAAPAVRESLQQHGITHIYVDWQEILRYRTTYGYTPFVSPDRLNEWVLDGVLEPPVTLDRRSTEGMSAPRAGELADWGPELITGDPGHTQYDAVQVFAVATER